MNNAFSPGERVRIVDCTGWESLKPMLGRSGVVVSEAPIRAHYPEITYIVRFSDPVSLSGPVPLPGRYQLILGGFRLQRTIAEDLVDDYRCDG